MFIPVKYRFRSRNLDIKRPSPHDTVSRHFDVTTPIKFTFISPLPYYEAILFAVQCHLYWFCIKADLPCRTFRLRHLLITLSNDFGHLTRPNEAVSDSGQYVCFVVCEVCDVKLSHTGNVTACRDSRTPSFCSSPQEKRMASPYNTDPTCHPHFSHLEAM